MVQLLVLLGRGGRGPVEMREGEASRGGAALWCWQLGARPAARRKLAAMKQSMEAAVREGNRKQVGPWCQMLLN